MQRMQHLMPGLWIEYFVLIYDFKALNCGRTNSDFIRPAETLAVEKQVEKL